ncbi:MAG TPA: hypothetical protein VFN85_04340 [Solirubrobacterales bacterium]|nr:hypothetical protein [Solirubrobacterales bacterium]
MTTKSKPTDGDARRPGKRAWAPDERPPAPWGNAPLAELVILAGIVSLAIGVIGGHPTAIGAGVALAGLGGLEVAIREHFAGYRSHTTLLAGAAFVLVTGLVFYAAHTILAVALAIGAVAFAIIFYLARRAFQRASGGLSYRISSRG